MINRDLGEVSETAPIGGIINNKAGRWRDGKERLEEANALGKAEEMESETGLNAKTGGHRPGRKNLQTANRCVIAREFVEP